MEDCNLLAADGVVVCCCCPCLILQFVVYILLKLPYRLARNSRRLVPRRFSKKKRKRQMTRDGAFPQGSGGGEIRIEGELARFIYEGVSLSPYHECRKTFNEVENAFEEFSQQGQFGFGSFWGRRQESSILSPVIIGQEEFDAVLQYHFMEMIKNL